MSFFDDTKNAGMILLIIALLGIVFTAIAAFAFEPYKDADMWKKIVLIVGAVIGGAVFLIVGMGIMKGSCMIQIGDLFSDVSSKFGVVVAITAAYGLSEIVGGVFTLIGFGTSGIASIVIGVLFILLAWLLASGESDARKVVWIILLILFIIYLIISIFAALVLVGIPDLLLSIFLVTYLLSPEVKGKCGM